MAAPRKARKAVSRPRKGAADAEYRFKIDAFTPATMPMARLAEYMAHLAEILGEETAVHFERLEPGSTILVHKVKYEAIPKVRERTASVRRGDGPRDALRAYRTINKLLREDNGVGVLQERKAGPTIIRFPGREETEEKFAAVRQHGSLDGMVMRVGGTDETVPVLLQVEDQQIAGCWTTRGIAKQLALRLFEHVRVFGRGRWNRDAEGKWNLIEFRIESFDALQDASLTDALAALRTTEGEWNEGAYRELQVIRHGPPGEKNGGH